MIRICSCGTRYNDSLAKKCPLCHPPKKRKRSKNNWKRQGMRLELRNFLKDDNREKRKAGSGYKYKQKTKS